MAEIGMQTSDQNYHQLLATDLLMSNSSVWNIKESSVL